MHMTYTLGIAAAHVPYVSYLQRDVAEDLLEAMRQMEAPLQLSRD